MPRYRTCSVLVNGRLCGRPTTGTRCTEHERARNNSTARGYGADHQRQRAELERTLPAYCWYGCGRILTATDPWVAAHVIDGDPTSPRVVSCRSCNEQAKVRASDPEG